MSGFAKAANFAQKAVVTGLVSVFGYQLYQIGRNVASGMVEHPVMESTYFKDVSEKVSEEYKTKDNKVDQREWYEEDDSSYLKDQVRANITKPEFQKEYQQRKQS